jgi:uncharacterized delta-60 repeat protein
MVQQTDGKIVALLADNDPGTAYVEALIRLNTDGSIDTTFGNGGYIYIYWDGTSQRAYSLAIQTINGEERLVIAGGTPCGRNNCLRAERYTSAGNLDTSFGTIGVASASVSAPVFAHTQADQKIVFATQAGSLVRMNLNGAIDVTFGVSGVSVASGLGNTNALAVQPDGRWILTGTYTKGSSSSMAAVRYNVDGSLDDGGKKDSTKGDAFGTAGMALAGFSQGSANGYSVAVDSSGRPTLCGTVTPASGVTNRYGAIARFLPSGQVDTAFGQSGRVLFRVGTRDSFDVLALQSDGRIVAAGTSTDPQGVTRSDLLLARFESNGAPDTTFGGSGWVRTDVWGGDNGVPRGQSTVLIQKDPIIGSESIFVGGYTKMAPADVMQNYATFLRFPE